MLVSQAHLESAYLVFEINSSKVIDPDIIHSPSWKNTGLLRSILKSLDPTFFDRVTWLKPGEIARVENGTLTVGFHHESVFDVQPKYGASRYLQKWLSSPNPQLLPSSNDVRKVVFYSRVPPQAKHGRIMDEVHNRAIISLIQRSLDRNGRTEKLVEFDGTVLGDNGSLRTMTFVEQFQLFRSASTVIGPHGTGLSNMLWMDLSECSGCDPPKVVEFTIGPLNIGSFDPDRDPFARTYAFKYWGLPYDYHHILFLPNSTDQRTFVDLEVLENLLNDLWRNKQLSESSDHSADADRSRTIKSINNHSNEALLPKLQDRNVSLLSQNDHGLHELEFVHIPKTAGTSIEVAGKSLNLSSYSFVLKCACLMRVMNSCIFSSRPLPCTKI